MSCPLVAFKINYSSVGDTDPHNFVRSGSVKFSTDPDPDSDLNLAHFPHSSPPHSHLIFHPSSLAPSSSSLNSHASSLNPHPFLPCPTPLIPPPSPLLPNTSFLFPHPSTLLPHLSFLIFPSSSPHGGGAQQLLCKCFHHRGTEQHPGVTDNET